MKSPIGIHSIRYGYWRTQGFGILLAVLLIIIGFILALLTFKLDFLALPIVVFLFLILPWLIQDPFRLFIWLIVTWPVLTIYARIPLPAGLPDITYERVLVVLILSIILIDKLVSKRELHKVGMFGVLAGIYIAAQISVRAHVLWFGGIGVPDLAGLLRIVLVPIAMYWLTKNLLVSRWHLKWLLYALILASVIIGFSGIIEQIIGVENSLFAVPQELGGSTIIRYMDVPGGRAAGVMGNPGIYGAILGMGVLASLVCIVHAERTLTKAALVTTTIVLLFGVFASYTRAAWISVVVALFFVQFFMGNLWRKTLPFFLVGMLLLIFAWGSLGDNPLMESRVLNPNNVITRIDLAQLAWNKFLEKPFFGWGFGAFNNFGLMRLGLSSHNTYLSLLVDGGLFVFLSFLSLPTYLLYKTYRVYGFTKKNSFARNVLAAMTGCLLIFLMSGLVRELSYFGYFFALFWISAAIIEHLGAEITNQDDTLEINMLRQSVSKDS